MLLSSAECIGASLSCMFMIGGVLAEVGQCERGLLGSTLFMLSGAESDFVSPS